MMMEADERERWQQCQLTAQGLAEDMDAVLMIIDRLDTLNFDDATEQCLVVQRTNPPGSPEYALALEARDWLYTLRYLREQTTVAQMLTAKLEFIKGLMTDPPRPLGTPPSVANGDSLPFVGPQPQSVATLRPQSPVGEGELARRRRQLMAIHPDADMNDIEFELALDMNGL